MSLSRGGTAHASQARYVQYMRIALGCCVTARDYQAHYCVHGSKYTRLLQVHDQLGRSQVLSMPKRVRRDMRRPS